MNQIKARRAKLQASDSDDTDSDYNEDDDGNFDSGKSSRVTTVRSRGPTRTRRRSSVEKMATPRQRRQSLLGSAPLSNLTEASTNKKELTKYRRGSVISNVAPPSEPTTILRSDVDTYDLTQIPEPTHTNILEVLSKRWQDGLIYTSVGDCLISVQWYHNWVEMSIEYLMVFMKISLLSITTIQCFSKQQKRWIGYVSVICVVI
jgi:hypothetical protein